jgi:hypothetical protein
MAGEGRKLVRALEKGLTVAVKAGKGFVREVVEAIDEAPKAFERFGEAIEEVVEHADRGTDEGCKQCGGTRYRGSSAFTDRPCAFCAPYRWTKGSIHWHCCPRGSTTALCGRTVNTGYSDVDVPQNEDPCPECHDARVDAED